MSRRSRATAAEYIHVLQLLALDQYAGLGPLLRKNMRSFVFALLRAITICRGAGGRYHTRVEFALGAMNQGRNQY